MDLTEQQLLFRKKIDEISDFNDAFEIVKEAVFAKFQMHRAGLSLVLQVMPSNLGAYHILGSNIIAINRFILAAIKEITKSKQEYNAYLFMVMAHEYMHSLGIVDESTVRSMTHDLCRSLLGDDHSSTKMARQDPSSLYPALKSFIYNNDRFGTEFETVRNFDKKNQSYIQ